MQTAEEALALRDTYEGSRMARLLSSSLVKIMPVNKQTLSIIFVNTFFIKTFGLHR